MDFSALNRKYWVGGIVMEKVILCYGDSNTWGYNPATAKRFPREIRWTGRLQALLGKEYVVIEEGLNSRTVVWDDPVNGYRSGFSYLIPCLDSQKPVDLVIVMLGTNDTQERFQLNGFNIARSMRRILDAIEISRSGPNETAPKVLLVAPPHILDSLPETDLGENMGKGCEQRSKEIAKYYQLLSEERGARFWTPRRSYRPARSTLCTWTRMATGGWLKCLKMTDFLFGPYMLVVFFGTGLYLTIRTKGIQFRKFGLAMRTMFSRKQRDDSDGEIRSFWALASALSSCIGIANIAGVAAALAVGGPGAVFWMWVAALLGMATKYCEITLALYTREKDENGVWHGGAMYLLKNGFKKQNPITKFLAGFFAVATTFVGLVSCNMLQTNTVVSSLSPYNVNPYLIGIIFAVLCGIVIIGGVKRLGRVTSILTPTMGCIYVLAALVILVLNADGIIPGLKLIVTSAFTGTAAVGGFSGAAVSFAIRQGVARGIMSNEAGIGSSAMIHATATVKHPCEQGIFGILEVFFDTIVVCTMTALVIISTGVWSSGETSAALSGLAFSTGLPGEWGNIIVIVCTILFVFSTLLGWSWYAETGVTFLFGDKAILPFRFVWCLCAFLGAIVDIDIVWHAADTVNGLMAIPNLISLWIFAGTAVKLTNEYFSKDKSPLARR